MKGGLKPIHIMRWAASDYVNDPWVKLAASRNDTGALAVYHLFLNHSFMEGGYLPSDPDALSGVLGLSISTIKKALLYWSAPKCGLILIKDGRAWNPRVIRDVTKELRFRRKQAKLGREGGRGRTKGKPKGSLLESESPPSPSPFPAPSPAPSPPPAPLPAPAPRESTNPVALAASGGRSKQSNAQLAAAGAAWVDYDPRDQLEARLVKRCEELAEMVAALDHQRDATDTERREVLEAVTATPAGKSMTTVRGASNSWLRQSLRACDDFERDHEPEPPAEAPAEEA